MTARDFRTEVYWAYRRALRLTLVLPRVLLRKIKNFVRKSPRERAKAIANYRYTAIARYRLRRAGPDFTASERAVRLGNDRTAYVIGLWGAGRHYVMELMLQNIGERAAYIREQVGLYQGPTSMIHLVHSTMKHVSRGHLQPALTSRLLESVGLGFADLIFVYRHPLDSLLTNWLCWRTMIRANRVINISEVYKSTDDFCADLERNFSELKALAEGDPDFLAVLPKGPRFMSLPEFVEETALFAQCAPLALRFEDFSIDPVKEFSKIVDVMSADVDVTHLRLDPPKSRPYGYLAVKEKLPQFGDLIEGLDAETKRRIEKLGYTV